MAISKKRKQEVVTEYVEWMNQSRALILTEYTGLSMNDLDELRRKLRDVGGEFHIVKNTLGKLALEEAGLPVQPGFFEGSTAIGFAFEDAPATAKTMVDFASDREAMILKGGYLGQKPVTAAEVKALAELPPLPVMRAQLLGTILAPASQLTRILAEPGRQIAAVLRAFSEKEATAEAA